MASRILIFDHYCAPIVEIEAPTTPRSWVLNDYGRAEFSLGFDASDLQVNQICREEYLQFGNLVHIIHTPTTDEAGNVNGTLPDWSGIILPPRKWDYGVCHITAYSAEAILKFRALKHKEVTGTPKSVVEEIIDMVNESAPNIKFQPGNMDDLQQTYPDALRTSAYDHIKKVSRDTGMDWNVTGEVNRKGYLDFYINLYEKKGQSLNVTLNSDNTELNSPLMTEQGTPYNQIYGYSHAQTSRDRFGPLEEKNQGAFDDYGALQLNQVILNKRDQTSVRNAVRALAENRGRPVKLIARIVLDEGDIFSDFDIGDTVNITDTNVGFSPSGNYGFDSTARIVSMQYNDLSNKVSLNVEVT